MNSIPPLSRAYEDIADEGGQLSVCVVTSELLGPTKNGGMGTATTGLIEQLRADGHRVTVLYTHVQFGLPSVAERDWQHWVDSFAKKGVELVCIEHTLGYNAWKEKAWLVHQFIVGRTFELVYYSEHHGSGYYCLAAKRAGLESFSTQLHCVVTHGSTEWIQNINDQYIESPADLEVMGLERRSVEWADVVIGPSRYLLREYAAYGWHLPDRTYQQPYPLPAKGAVRATGHKRHIDEIVFFGRLETRKGLWLFCDALDEIACELEGRTVTFLGRIGTNSNAGAVVVSRSGSWPFGIRLLTDLNQDQALAYLSKPGRLAVMPSLADNSPCVVYECLEKGIPFVTTRGSGADEIVHPDCWPEVMVEPNVPALATHLTRILEHGGGTAWASFDADENLAVWSAWHRKVATRRNGMRDSSEPSPVSPDTRPDWASTLVLVIDRGDGRVSLLVKNFAAHIRCFSGDVEYAVLSARRGALLQMVATVLIQFGATKVSVFEPTEIDKLRRRIADYELVFCVDADTEILPSFASCAMRALRTMEVVAVSCIVGECDEKDGTPEIVKLPTGDLPGLKALGSPIGSNLWAMAPRKIDDIVAAIAYYDDVRGELASSETLGQIVMQRSLLRGAMCHLFPFVGGVTARHSRGRLPIGRPRNDAREVAQSLGLPPTVHGAGAAWFALSKFGCAIEKETSSGSRGN